MPYQGFSKDETGDQDARAGEASLLIERHVEEGVLKPSIMARNYEQPFCIRCIKKCAKFGQFAFTRVCRILSRSYGEGRRLDSLDGIRGLVFLLAFGVEVDQAAELIYPGSEYGTSQWRENCYGLWKTIFRILTQGSAHFLTVFLILAGFLATFTLFLRSGPLLQKDGLGERERLTSFFYLSMNFLGGRLLRVWPVLQLTTAVTFIWGYYLSRNNEVSENLNKCATKSGSLLLISNFMDQSCSGNIWAISLICQLYLVIPFSVYFYRQSRTRGYLFTWILIIFDLILRSSLMTAGVNTDISERLPWFRSGEFAVGIMLCFSFIDRFEIAKLKSRKPVAAFITKSSSRDKLNSSSTMSNTVSAQDVRNDPSSLSYQGGNGSGGSSGVGNQEEDCFDKVEGSMRKLFKAIFAYFGEDWDTKPINPLDLFGAVSRDTNPLPQWRIVFRKVYRTLVVVFAVLLLYQGNEDVSAWSKPRINSLFIAQCIEIYGDIIFAIAIGFMLKALLYNQDLNSNEETEALNKTISSSSSLKTIRSYQYVFKCFLENPVLFALSQLSYSAFTVQFICCVVSVQYLKAPTDADYAYFFLVYFVALGVTLLVAFPISLFVERPFIDMGLSLGCARKSVSDTKLQVAGTKTSNLKGGTFLGSGVSMNKNSQKSQFFYKDNMRKDGSHVTKSGIHLLAPPDGFASVKIVPRSQLRLFGGGKEGGGEVIVNTYDKRETYQNFPPSPLSSNDQSGDNSNGVSSRNRGGEEESNSISAALRGHEDSSDDDDDVNFLTI